jgi:DNA-binding CsgD family transcriptional regulator/tetratricopeptide (TPR) repeat protein
MVGRASSPVFVGRDDAIVALRNAVGRSGAGEGSLVLVEGEAGIGKTRLLAEFARSVQDDIAVVAGSCVQLTEGSLPYVPIVEVLDELATRGSGRRSRRARALRDELSGSVIREVSSAASRGRLFLELRHLFADAAEDRPLVVVIDDLHWADQSTLDAVAYLSGRLTVDPLTIILAYRSDELHRRHPLRPLLAELQRGPLLDRVALRPLAGEDVRRQIAAIGGPEPDDAFTQRVVELADGNPFHVEELVSLGGPWTSLPRSLRSLLLARIERLEPDVLGVVRDAAVVGGEVEEDLLAMLGARAEPGLRELLRVAVEHFVLEPVDDSKSYRFRHALIREAVYDDLLPADRIALHRRVADVLAAARPRSLSPAVAAAELARHRDAAQQPEFAREAWVHAGELAMRARAWTEAASAFERVLAIDATGGPGAATADLAVTRLAMRAIWFAGRPRQGLDLLRRFLEREGPRLDPLFAADGWMDITRITNDIGDEAQSIEANRRARVLAPRRPPNRVRALTMGGLASQWMAEGRYRKAIRLADCVIAMADRIGANDVRASARAQRSPALLALGHSDEGRRDFDDARRIAVEHGDLDILGVVLFNCAEAFRAVGALREALDHLLEASAIGSDLGLERSWDPWLLAAAADAACWLGNWSEADAHLAAIRSYELRSLPRAMRAGVEAFLAVHRGDRAGATAALAEADGVATSSVDAVGMVAAARVRRDLVAGDAAAAVAGVDVALGSLAATDEMTARAWLAELGAEAAADLAERMTARRDRFAAKTASARAASFAALAADIDGGRVIREALGSPMTRAFASSAAAHAERAAGHSDPGPFAAAAAAFDAIEAAPKAAWCRYRLGEAAVTSGDRNRAEQALRDSLAAAGEIGDTLLATTVEGLARRARLTLQPARTAVEAPVASTGPRRSDPWDLSRREREVLDLLADGLTNREISRRLFITEKTASSHVTHILDKLGVSSRTEAALAAARAGVVGDLQEESSASG